jgi:hypothetical protein
VIAITVESAHLFVSRCAGRRWRANGKCVLAVLAARKMGVANDPAMPGKAEL